MIDNKKTAAYKIIKGADGNCYQFYCDLSGGLVCTTQPVKADTPEEELMIAWENYGRRYFNRCHKCGSWVTIAMYNPDVFSCVRCTPIEDYPDYCPECGAKTQDPSYFCHICGMKFFYGGESEDEKTKHD